jgi:hypothetical protein
MEAILQANQKPDSAVLFNDVFQSGNQETLIFVRIESSADSDAQYLPVAFWHDFLHDKVASPRK